MEKDVAIDRCPNCMGDLEKITMYEYKCQDCKRSWKIELLNYNKKV